MPNVSGAKRALSRCLATGGYAALMLAAAHDAAFAYLDPGTGSIILQTLIAGIIGMAAFARMYWTRFREVLRRTFRANNQGSGPKG